MTKILLVEDDKSLREIYGVRLLAEGYDIVSAGDGEEALAMAIKEKPGLIVSDVMMPKISGFDMLDILRSTTETKEIKVIMMTALSSEDQRARGEALGADRYLVKSQVGIEDVVRTVHDVLKDAPVAGPTAAQSFNAPASTPNAFTTSSPAPTVVPTIRVAPQPTPAAAPYTYSSPQTVSTPTTPPVAASTMPQPTAPFSTPRPGNLADRVIHPLERPETTGPGIAEQITQELSGTPVAPFTPPVPSAPQMPVTSPQTTPYAPTAPVDAQQVPTPQAPTEPAHDLNFEETPLTSSSTNQPQ